MRERASGRVEDVVDERSEQWRTRSRVICTVSGPVDKGECTAFKRTACCRAGIFLFLDIKEIWFVSLPSPFPSSGYYRLDQLRMNLKTTIYIILCFVSFVECSGMLQVIAITFRWSLARSN